jgi:AraC-like DNA-binding protein
MRDKETSEGNSFTSLAGLALWNSVLLCVGLFAYFSESDVAYRLMAYAVTAVGLILNVGRMNKGSFLEAYETPPLQTKEDQGDGASSLLSPAEAKRLREKLEKKLYEEKIYLDDSLNLDKLADALSTKSYKLTDLLNNHMNTNYHDLVNQARVEEAKRIIISGDYKTYLDVCYQVGFNSKSAFYGAFKRIVNMSPAAYEQSAQGKN